MLRQLFDFIHKARLIYAYSPTATGKWKDYAVTRRGAWITVVKAPTLFGPDVWQLKDRTVSSREIVRWGNTFEWGT